MFYNELGVKVIPANIGELLTPIGLAYWFGDDGYYHKLTGGFYFSTNSYTLAENELLVKVLKGNRNIGERLFVIWINPDNQGSITNNVSSRPHLLDN